MASQHNIDVFLSYTQSDRKLADDIVAKLRQCGFECWIDRQDGSVGPVGKETYETFIRDALERAKTVVVLWTRTSVDQFWVFAEATRARELRKLFQLVVTGVTLPLPFNGLPAVEVGARGDSIAIERETFLKLVDSIREHVGLKGPNERIVTPRKVGEAWTCEDQVLRAPVPGTDVFSSFHPCRDSGVFSLMRVETTDGWVSDKVPRAEEMHLPFADDPGAVYEDYGNEPRTRGRGTRKPLARYLKTRNEVYFISDPVRPYSVQIGELRSHRDHASLGFVRWGISAEGLQHISMSDPGLCELLAEVLDTDTALAALWEQIEGPSKHWKTEDGTRNLRDDERLKKIERIRGLIARNPSAAVEQQQEGCIFCKRRMQKDMTEPLDEQDRQLGAYLIANAFPFGPYFHYIVITDDPIHAWEDLEFRHVRGMNLLVLKYLRRHFQSGRQTEPTHPVQRSAGVQFGFNSSVKHLVLGRRTHSSAGGSMPHISKQVWGTAPRTSNLAEHLITVSDAYWRQGIDYQGMYLEALRIKDIDKGYGYVVWEDENVALYVPYGQCSRHELQAMVIRPTPHLLELTDEEMLSLSKAEYIALRLYRRLGVSSYNHIMLSKLFDDHRAPQFRLVVIFVTRDSDFAMSELSMLYVVDQHPWDSRQAIQNEWVEIKDEVYEEIGQ